MVDIHYTYIYIYYPLFVSTFFYTINPEPHDCIIFPPAKDPDESQLGHLFQSYPINYYKP